MQYRYQIWMQYKWGINTESPEIVCATLDEAMHQAKKISGKIHKTLKGEPFYPTIFVLDCSNPPYGIRGFGMNGKWVDALDSCKSCRSSAMDVEDCSYCKGAAWKHIQ